MVDRVPFTPMEPESEEGWFTDPFGRHEARWMSEGTPTKLVRDDGVETYDDPPDEEPTREAVRIETGGAPGGVDLLRAGQQGQPDDLASLAERMDDAALEGGAHPEIDLP